MSKELRGVIVTKGKVEAEYRFKKMPTSTTWAVAKKTSWSDETVALAKALLTAADNLTPELDDVVQVQTYTALSDADCTAMGAPGDLVDLTFRPGSSPSSIRIGDDEEMPAELAVARDALHTAIIAEL